MGGGRSKIFIAVSHFFTVYICKAQWMFEGHLAQWYELLWVCFLFAHSNPGCSPHFWWPVEPLPCPQKNVVHSCRYAANAPVFLERCFLCSPDFLPKVSENVMSFTRWDFIPFHIWNVWNCTFSWSCSEFHVCPFSQWSILSPIIENKPIFSCSRNHWVKDL